MINALLYFTPAFVVEWLFALDIANVAMPDLLIIGAALIVGANMAMARRARR